MSRPEDWERDRHVVAAMQELENAGSLVRSAMARCTRDRRATGCDFEGTWAKVAELEDALAAAIGCPPRALRPASQQVLTGTIEREASAS